MYHMYIIKCKRTVVTFDLSNIELCVEQRCCIVRTETTIEEFASLLKVTQTGFPWENSRVANVREWSRANIITLSGGTWALINVG